MTLIAALKTDEEVYLAADSFGYTINRGNNKFSLVQKYKKINEHVEVLISGILNDGLRFIEEMKRDLRGVDLENYDAFEIAKEIEKVATPKYERIINIPKIKKALVKNKALLLEEWPLDMLVCGMDKDENGTFAKPSVYELQVQHAFLFSEVPDQYPIVGHPDATTIVESFFENRLTKSALESPSDYENLIYSCFVDVIQKMSGDLKNNESLTIEEPIHIARINERGYEILR